MSANRPDSLVIGERAAFIFSLNDVKFYLFLVELVFDQLFQVDFELKIKEFVWKVRNEVNEHVQWHMLNAFFRNDHVILVNALLSHLIFLVSGWITYVFLLLILPLDQDIQQGLESIINELELNPAHCAQHVGQEWNLHLDIAEINVPLDCSSPKVMNVREPFLISSQFSHCDENLVFF